jgi:D-alanyl-D-alanine carboxypeptidase/D-alanyl-D-alanine-endopeptidase (penicillin-binding protein 4)
LKILGLLSALMIGAPTPPVPNQAAADDELPAALDSMVRGGVLGHSHAGVVVYSLDEGRVIYAFHPDELLNPASNTKVFTTAAALARLGSDFRYLTEVYVDSVPRDGVVDGNLTLRGHGDPSLVSERIWQMSNDLWHAGLREVTGDLVLDDTAFDSVVEGPGWDQDRSDRAYMAPISALSCNYSSFALYVSPADHAGSKARVEIEPMSGYFKIDNRALTGAGSRRLRKPVTSGHTNHDGYHVSVTGRVPVGQPTTTLWRRVGDPTLYCGETVKELLARRGIKIRGKVRKAAVSPNATLFYTTESESLDLLLKRVNKQSQNFVAESILKTMGAQASKAPGSWPGGVAAVADFLEREVGIPKNAYLMKNGSGLNDVNRFSAAQVVKVLAYMYPRLTVAPEYLSSLGIAGKDGTVRFRMGGTPAVGRVRAKTGTLEDVTALSGYAESVSGHHYAFSVLVNDYPDTLRQAIAAEDQLAVSLASAGAAPPTLAEPAAPLLTARPPLELARPERLRAYARLAEARDAANAPLLATAVRDEREYALRALAADALYQSEPDAVEASEALLESVPKNAEEFEALHRVGKDAGLNEAFGTWPIWASLVDLASDGDARALDGLLDMAMLADKLPADDRAVFAAGLTEVARQAPRELLLAMGQGPRTRGDVCLRLLISGLYRDPEAKPAFGAAVAAQAKISNPAGLHGFSEAAERALSARVHTVVNAGFPPVAVPSAKL